MTALAIAVITGITAAGYLMVRTDHTGAGAAFAAAALPGSRAMAVLEHKRQQMILMDSASHTMHLVGTPKVASRLIATQDTGGGGGAGGGGGGASVFTGPPPSPGTVKAIAYKMMASFGFDAATQFPCVNNIWTRESNWNPLAENATSGAYGIPQALPGSKMASAGSDWQTDATTQIKWGLGYIKSVYGTPCNAWAFWQAHDYY